MVNFSKNAIKILNKRYLLKDEKSNIKETPDEMLVRVANIVCKDNEKLKSKILEMMRDLRFLPNTPTLMNAGTTNMLSACFVIDVDDTLESIIHDAGWQQAFIHKMGGGVGINFSKLRPKGDLIKRTGGITSGVLGFLEVFNTLSEVIRQGGKRDGANMGLLSISHPEIENWIDAKIGENKFKFRNFNLSVLITDEFMMCVEDDLDWNLVFNNKIYKTIKAKYLFDMICKSAWKCGCPGLVFVDEINRYNPLVDKGMRIECTNPCGEQPLYVGNYKGDYIAESCNLGSLNLSKYVIDYDNEFNMKGFKEDIEVAVEFLDMIIDANEYPFEFIDKGTKLTRKIGLGITGLSDCLIKLKLEYGSELALELIKSIMIHLKEVSHKKSEEFGKVKGYYPLADITGIYRRNLFTTTIAPTGTIGRLMLGHPYSGGIEPPPAIDMSSYIIDSKVVDGTHPLLVQMLKERAKIDLHLSKFLDNILERIKKDRKSIQNIEGIPKDIKKLFLVAEEIPIETHIKVQALVQEYTDNAVSKTINMKNESTLDDVAKAFILAWKSKCKGVTIYRDNSKDKQVFESSNVDMKNIDELRPIDDLTLRPDILPALSFTKKTACNTLFFNITHYGRCDKDALESFIDTNGGCLAMRNGIAISISVYQRILETISPEFARRALEIVTQHLINVSCPACTNKMIMEKNSKLEIKHPVDSISCPSALGKVLEFMLTHNIETTIDGIPLKYDNIKTDKNIIKSNSNESNKYKKCPDCGSMTIRQEGCMNNICLNCGWGGCV